MDLTTLRRDNPGWDVGVDPGSSRCYAKHPHFGTLYGDDPGELNDRLEGWRQYATAYPDVSGAVPPVP